MRLISNARSWIKYAVTSLNLHITYYCLFQSRHSDSLALLYVLHDDYDRACYYAGIYEQNFLAVSNFVWALPCSMETVIFSHLWSETEHGRQNYWILIGSDRGHFS